MKRHEKLSNINQKKHQFIGARHFEKNGKSFSKDLNFFADCQNFSPQYMTT